MYPEEEDGPSNWSHSGGAGLGLLGGGFRKQFLCLMNSRTQPAALAGWKPPYSSAHHNDWHRLRATGINKSTENEPNPPPGTQHPNQNLVFVDTNMQPGLGSSVCFLKNTLNKGKRPILPFPCNWQPLSLPKSNIWYSCGSMLWGWDSKTLREGQKSVLPSGSCD